MWLCCQLWLLPASVSGDGESAPSPVGNPYDVLGAGLRGGGSAGACNVPTDGTPSPLFGARDFSQQMLRFEGFGTLPMGGEGNGACTDPTACPYSLAPPGGYLDPDPYLPLTATAAGSENFDDVVVGQGLTPYPAEECNEGVSNPWQHAIEETHTGKLLPLVEGKLSSFADGRPPGPQYGHQRYAEFYPSRYFQSGIAGARVNRGARDSAQPHGYAIGECAADGGLYHNTVHGPLADVCDGLTTREACESESNPETIAADKLCKWESESCSGRFDGTTAGIPIKFHPAMPVQDPQALWTFEGTLPPKLLKVRYAASTLFRNYNTLPIKFEANRGFGNHFITTHEHNGHVPAESDGYAEAFFLPGQFYDYHWPMIAAGHDSINRDATDYRASTPCLPGEELELSLPSPERDGADNLCGRGQGLTENPTRTASGDYADPQACGWRKEVRVCPAAGEKGAGRINFPGDWREIMSTHWFHDHMIDYTAQNVYKGNAAMMNYYSAIDRGNECLEDGLNLRFPSGCGLNEVDGEYSWGNRGYDVNLMLASKAWGQDDSRYPGTTVDDTSGQLWFATFNTDGFIGDRMTVNWLYNPYFNVRARSYRLRILNGDVARFMTVALVVERQDEKGEFPGALPGVSYDRVPMYMIANDGNIMEHVVPFDGSMDLDADGDRQDHNGILPTLSIGERYDVIVDFSRYAPGSKLYLLNALEHDDGRGPKDVIAIDEILSGEYDGCDSTVGKFLEFRVHAYAGEDKSMDPTRYVPGNKNGIGGKALKLIPLPEITEAELLNAHHRTFEFGRGAATDSEPVTITRATFTAAAPAPSKVGSEQNPNYDYERSGHSTAKEESAQFPYVTEKPWGIATDGGDMLAGNFNQVTAAPQMGDLEVWHLINESHGWSHNIHIHFEEGRILTRDGKEPPEWEKWARKDTYRVGRMDDSGSEVTVALRFREFAGSYMEHCHNTQHEDHAMIMRWDIENPGQLKPFLLPENQWNGCTYTESDELPSASAQRSAEVGDPLAKAGYSRAHELADLLCPGGVTGDCPGVETSGEEAEVSTGGGTTAVPAPTAPIHPIASEPPVSEETRSERERRRADRKAEGEAEREARRSSRKAERDAARELRRSSRKAERDAKREVRQSERRSRRISNPGSGR